MRILKSLHFAVLLLFFVSAYAQNTIYISGNAENNIQGRLTPELKALTVEAAKINAVRAYFANQSTADSKRFSTIEKEINSNINSYIITTRVINETVSNDGLKYSVYLQIELDVNRIRQAIIPNSNTKNKRPEIAFLFVARELSEQKRFDDRIYKRTESSSSISDETKNYKSSIENEVVAKKGLSASLKETEKSSAEGSIVSTFETGGSSTSKKTERRYKVSSSQTFNAAFLEALTVNDWPLDPIELETDPGINIDLVKEDFAKFDEIQTNNLQKLFSQARDSGFRFLAIGTLDISMPVPDVSLGVPRVGVRINAKVYDIGGRRVRTILSIQPTLVNGFDQDELRAQSKAVREAASRASKAFLSQLSNKTLDE
jgi:hypothetical protein